MNSFPSALANSAPEPLKRSYSDEEISHIYELARFLLENGDLHRAEPIFLGLVEVAPQFAPAWLGLAYLQLFNRNFEAAVNSSRHALKLNSELLPAMLFLIAALLCVDDHNSAGTYLGEFREKIDSGEVSDPQLIRFYRGQLARYQAR
jgi:hypothetical protein